MMFVRNQEDSNYGSEEVPGTIELVHFESKSDFKQESEVVLHPQPSSDPNDPLIWPKFKKEMQFILLAFLAFFESVSTVWNGPVWGDWIKELDCTYEELNRSNGVLFIFIAVGCIVLQGVASKLGKRIVYLVCTLLQVVGAGLMAKAGNIVYITVANGITGFSSAPMYSLIEMSSVDIYFQHERGAKVAYVIFALYGAVALGPLATGFISDGVGWRWAAYILLIVSAALFILNVFVLEDTTFRREDSNSKVCDNNNEETKIEDKKGTVQVSGVKMEQLEGSENDDYESDGLMEIRKKSYLSKMNPIQTEYASKRRWFWCLTKPLCLLIMPNVFFSGILQAEQQMWLTFITSTQSEFFSAPPYNFSNAIVGVTNSSSLVGTVLGMLYGGQICDKVSLWLSKRNHGIFEPEFRLYVMIIPTVINAIGLLAYGLGAAYGVHWTVPVIIGEGFLGFSMSSITGIAYVYCTDSYPNFKEDGIASISFLNNAIVTVFTFFINRWMDASGLKLMIWLLFMISLIINGMSIFFIIFGKRLRWYTKDLYNMLSDLGDDN